MYNYERQQTTLLHSLLHSRIISSLQSPHLTELLVSYFSSFFSHFNNKFRQPFVKFLVSVCQYIGSHGILSFCCEVLLLVKLLRSNVKSFQTLVAQLVLCFVFVGILPSFLCSNSLFVTKEIVLLLRAVFKAHGSSTTEHSEVFLLKRYEDSVGKMSLKMSCPH